MIKEEEFVRVIKAHEAIIFKITTIYTNSKEDQKDLYQDVVFQLWKSFDSFRNEAKISTWMYRVALNTALTHINKAKRQPYPVSIDEVVVQQLESYDPSFEEKLKIMYAHIKELNILEKGLILLFLEGKKYEEISEITGLSTTNVGTRISRIKKKLKEKIIN